MNELQQLVEAKSWPEAVDFYKGIQQPTINDILFAAKAHLEMGQLKTASEVLELLELKQQALPSWGVNLKFTILFDMGEVEQAFGYLESLDARLGSLPESLKDHFVSTAIQNNRFDFAKKLNLSRDVVSRDTTSPRYAIAIQTFNKVDTLENVLEGLLKCEGKDSFALVILQDHFKSSRDEELYKQGYLDVQNLISDWLPKLNQSFYSVEILANRVNKGTAPSCKKLLDKVSESYEGFLFLEDDCIPAPGALNWSKWLLDNRIGEGKVWFGTCESIFFNSKNKELSVESLNKLSNFATIESVDSAYTVLDFVPSTCFITKSNIWRECSEIRGCVRGPESLIKYVQSLDKKTVFPIVPRASDIGMQHELGFSVSVLGKENVKEDKSVFVVSSSTIHSFEEYGGNVDLLYSASVNLNPQHIDELMKKHK